MRGKSELAWLWGHADLRRFLQSCKLSPGERVQHSDPHPHPTQVFWEDGIVSGYRRPTSSALDCVLSSFQMTNETVNIWTHFLPTW